GFHRSMSWRPCLPLLTTMAGVGGVLDFIDVCPVVGPFLTSVVAIGAATTMLAAILARSRTEKRTDPVGERALRFWQGPLGRALFRVAGRRNPADPSILRVLGRLE